MKKCLLKYNFLHSRPRPAPSNTHSRPRVPCIFDQIIIVIKGKTFTHNLARHTQAKLR